MTHRMKSKNLYIVFALLGAAGLMLKRHYAGPGMVIVHSWGGNLTASFAAYFVMALGLLKTHLPYQRILAAAAALLLAEAFELTDGFGVMRNTFDAWDLAANAVGVALALALAIDTALPSDNNEKEEKP